MLFDRKKAAGVILQKMSEGGEVAPAADEQEGADPLHMAAEDMIAAIHNKSPQDFHKALGSYLDMRPQDDQPEEPEE
jgi:hypothetical protein